MKPSNLLFIISKKYSLALQTTGDFSIPLVSIIYFWNPQSPITKHNLKSPTRVNATPDFERKKE
jgi:hypothetical protein